MQLYYSRNIKDGEIILESDEHRHCSKVMRAAIGAEVHVTDGLGNNYTTKILKSDKSQTLLSIIDRVSLDIPHRVGVAIAPTKNLSRFEWFVEKATEIGVTDIYPIRTRYSERRIIKVDRASKIMISAIKQCKRSFLPRLHDMDIMGDVVRSTYDYNTRVMAYLGEDQRKLSDEKMRGDRLIFIGPEGGFSLEEAELALKNHVIQVSLGQNILRSETAGVAASFILCL